MCGASAVRSVGGMTAFLIVTLIVAPLLSAVLTAPIAKRSSERHRARRAAGKG